MGPVKSGAASFKEYIEYIGLVPAAIAALEDKVGPGLPPELQLPMDLQNIGRFIAAIVSVALFLVVRAIAHSWPRWVSVLIGAFLLAAAVGCTFWYWKYAQSSLGASFERDAMLVALWSAPFALATSGLALVLNFSKDSAAAA